MARSVWSTMGTATELAGGPHKAGFVCVGMCTSRLKPLAGGPLKPDFSLSGAFEISLRRSLRFMRAEARTFPVSETVGTTTTKYLADTLNPTGYAQVLDEQVAGAVTRTYSLTENAASSPQKVTLTGVGTTVSVSPTSLAFVTQKVGTTSLAKAITVTNKGTSILTISSIVKTSDFIIASKTCGTSLAAGASCKVNVAFKPTAKGTRTGSLSINHNGGASPAKVSLTGTGI